MAEKLFLIDGHSHLYRAFYAVKGGLTTPEGTPSNAVFGFTAMLRKLLRDHAPEYVAVAFDMPGPTFRHEMYGEYKATREKPPEEFIAQIPLAREVLQAMQIPVYALAGYEADDVLGTLTRLGVERGLDVVIVTGDKDAAQLLGPRVSILDTLKDTVTTAATLQERDGIAPEQVIEAMALSGDASDNVPGVPKVGPKTALELVRQFGTLERLIERLEEVKRPALRENLKQHVELARLSRRLVTIDTSVPIRVELADCRVKPPDAAKLGPVYQRLGFRQFLSELAPAPTREAAEYRLIVTEEEFAGFLAQLRRQRLFALDLETTSASPMAARICGLSFSWKPKEAYYVAVRGPVGQRVLEEKKVLAALEPILADPAIAKVGQNIKYDMIVLRNNGIEVQGVVFDTMVAAYVLNSERRRYALDDLAADFLDYRMIPITDLIGKGKSSTTMDLVPVERVAEYSCADADITLRLTDLFGPRLREQGMDALFAEYEMPLVPVLAEMEYQGIRIDVPELRTMSAWLGEKIAAAEKEIHAAADQEFNIGSPKQLQEVLFARLKLPKGRRTKTGASTDSEVLEQLAATHPLPGMVLEWRQLTKLKSTYVDTLPEMMHSDGRVHTSFNMTATSTGRLSSSDPNLQNIPIRTELGERIRKAFIPSGEGWRLLTADYSQIELRILAHICGDEALRRAFAEDQDIHRVVAAQIHGVPPSEVTPGMRRMAKTVNFGIIYGLSAYGLARDLRITPMEAETFIQGYFDRYPGVRRFIERTVEEARRSGYVTTLAGRRRPLPGLNDADRATRSFSERAAVNTVIQGTAADMTKRAMIRIHARLRAEGFKAKMLLQIHDELVFDFPEGEESRLCALVVEEMSGALKMETPVKVNTAVGRNWLEAK